MKFKITRIYATVYASLLIQNGCSFQCDPHGPYVIFTVSNDGVTPEQEWLV